MSPTGELAVLVAALVVGLLVLGGMLWAAYEAGKASVQAKLDAAKERILALVAQLGKEQAEARVASEGRRTQHDGDVAVAEAGAAPDPDAGLAALRGLLPPGDPRGEPAPAPAPPSRHPG